MSAIAERRLEEKDRRRTEILDAAELVAAEQGVDAITMDQVARKARISRALLYVYFQDRNDLHLGVSERGLNLLLSRFEFEAASHLRGLDQLVAIGHAYVQFTREYPVYFEALTRFHACVPDAMGPTGCILSCLEAGNRVHSVLVRVLQTGMGDGSVSREAGDPAAIAMTLWGFMHGIILISTTKELVLAQHGLGGDALVNQAVLLLIRAMEVRVAPNGAQGT
jgi:AcrR family transcriptional regulator